MEQHLPTLSHSPGPTFHPTPYDQQVNIVWRQVSRFIWYTVCVAPQRQNKLPDYVSDLKNPSQTSRSNVGLFSSRNMPKFISRTNLMPNTELHWLTDLHWLTAYPGPLTFTGSLPTLAYWPSLAHWASLAHCLHRLVPLWIAAWWSLFYILESHSFSY